MPNVNIEVPEGWRLLYDGERFQDGDKYQRAPGQPWQPIRFPSGVWNKGLHYPTIRQQVPNVLI